MGRYQCPLCSGRHQDEDLPRCSVHTLGYDHACSGCRTAATQTPCGGGR
ncbi:hypothetical protein [Streptosporangium sandarakinum]